MSSDKKDTDQPVVTYWPGVDDVVKAARKLGKVKKKRPPRMVSHPTRSHIPTMPPQTEFVVQQVTPNVPVVEVPLVTPASEHRTPRAIIYDIALTPKARIATIEALGFRVTYRRSSDRPSGIKVRDGCKHTEAIMLPKGIRKYREVWPL